MLKITIICLGKFKETAYTDLEKEFLKRTSPFAKVKLIELKEVAYKSPSEIEQVKLQESELIQKHIPKDCVVVLLQENGKSKNSIEFARFLERIGSIGQEICFVLGSGVGLHPNLAVVANYTQSLSPLTFPHNMARVILEEQIYRACTIILGKSYHK